MSITRREFLLSTFGASVGAIMPSFYFRALEFFEQFEEPLLVAPARVTQDLCVLHVDGQGPELHLGDPFADLPQLTFRQYFTQYDPEGFDRFEEQWGLKPSDLDQQMDEDLVWDLWGMKEGSGAQAYKLLGGLDLGDALSGPNAVGGLEFVEEYNRVGRWLSVRPENEVTLSLLQQRLNDLDTGIRIVTGYSL